MKKHKPEKRGGKKGWLTIGLLFLTLILSSVVWALTKPLPPITYASSLPPSTEINQTHDLAWPAYGQSAYGAVGYGVIAVRGEQKAFPIASIAKVMTAWCVLQKKPLNLGEQGELLTMTQADVDLYNKSVAENGSRVPVTLGGQISEYQALQALMLASANNMAFTLANWAYGSVEGLQTCASEQAKTMGMTTFVMTDPSGLDSTTVSSAADLVKLGVTTIKNPVFAEIVQQKSATIPMAGTITNYNAVLGNDGNFGIKTGNNLENPGAFLFASKRILQSGEYWVIGVVMNAPDLPTALRDSVPLAASGDGNYGEIIALTDDQAVGSFDVPWQGKVSAVSTTSLDFYGWKDTTIKYTTGHQAAQASNPAGTKTGDLNVNDTFNSAKNTVEVQTAEAISSPSFWWRLTHIF